MSLQTIRVVAVWCAVVTAIVGAGCSTSKSTAPSSAEAAYAEARDKFLEGEYVEAERLLDIVKLQYAGSAHADSVQFLLGECNFHEGQYILAAFEYSAVRKSFPSSPLNRIAQFNVAESYYHLSPPAGIDQNYTTKAIDEYQAFLEMYGKKGPTDDSLAERAIARIKELRDRIARKYYDTAVLYYNMNQFRASEIYCDLVQDKFYDTEYAEKALFLKIQDYVELRRFNEARREIDKFLVAYRASASIPAVRKLRESIENNVIPSK